MFKMQEVTRLNEMHHLKETLQVLLLSTFILHTPDLKKKLKLLTSEADQHHVRMTLS